jgi:hypothetical protein
MFSNIPKVLSIFLHKIFVLGKKISTFQELIELVSKLQHFSLKEEMLCLEEYRRKIEGHSEPAPTSTPSTGCLLLLSCG